MCLAHLDLVRKQLLDHPGIAPEQIVPAARGGMDGITPLSSLWLGPELGRILEKLGPFCASQRRTI